MMRDRDERVKISKKGVKVLECWVSLEEIRPQGIDVEDGMVQGRAKARFQTYWRPVFKDIILSPAEYRVEFKRGFAPGGQIISAFRHEDRRHVVVEV